MDADNDLEKAAIEDINELESIDLTDSGFKIVVLLDRIGGYDKSNGDWTDTRLFEITYDKNGLDNRIVSKRLYGMGLKEGQNVELNMGDPKTIKTFVTFVKSSYDFKYSSLIIWNHGGGWRSLSLDQEKIFKSICWDYSDNFDSLMMAELSQGLKGEYFDLIGFDACYMGMIEVGYQLKDITGIIIGSEDEEPEDGWDYRDIFTSAKLLNSEPLNFANIIVDSYRENSSPYNYTLSAFYTKDYKALVSKLDSFIAYLQNIDTFQILDARDFAADFNNDTNIDLRDFACQFTSSSESITLINKIDSIVFNNWSNQFYKKCGGLAIYFPAPNNWGELYYYNDENIDFTKDTKWDEFIKNILQ